MADGVIGEEEYTGTQSYGSFKVFWTNDEEFVYIAMQAKTEGWVSVGIQPKLRMKDADIILGAVTYDGVIVTDEFSFGDHGPHDPDVQRGGTDDILEYGGKEEGGFTTIEFKRALVTGDTYDLDIQPGINVIIWSYGIDDVPKLKHAIRGYGEIDIK